MLFSRGNLTKDRCASSEPPGLPGPLLSPNLKEEKKTPPKTFLYFRKWIYLALRLKNFLFFLKKKLFLYFGK